jgi:hypothetical protein
MQLGFLGYLECLMVLKSRRHIKTRPRKVCDSGISNLFATNLRHVEKFLGRLLIYLHKAMLVIHGQQWCTNVPAWEQTLVKLKWFSQKTWGEAFIWWIEDCQAAQQSWIHHSFIHETRHWRDKFPCQETAVLSCTYPRLLDNQLWEIQNVYLSFASIGCISERSNPRSRPVNEKSRLTIPARGKRGETTSAKWRKMRHILCRRIHSPWYGICSCSVATNQNVEKQGETGTVFIQRSFEELPRIKAIIMQYCCAR